jgi:hypothetical protein
LAEHKIWAKKDFYMQPIKKGDTFVKLLKSEVDAKKERENIRNLDLAVKSLKKIKKEDEDLLIPYFQKDAFIIFYELDFNKNLSTLYDEIIYGIGKSMKDNLLGKRIKSKPFLNTVIYLCYGLYYIEKEKFYNLLSHSFQRYLKEMKKNLV